MNDKAPDSAAAAKVAAEHKAKAEHDAKAAQHAKDQAARASDHLGAADDPGHPAERAAKAGAEAHTEPGMAPAGQGDQVILTGDAQAAARGGLHGDIDRNTAARDEAIEAGHVVEGTTAPAAERAMGIDPDRPKMLEEMEAERDDKAKHSKA